ncbi:MAG: hypothetical protein IAE78_23770 [Myxococcus sp.]|nr:hypothetical protein [Myxococcus sp.]
MPWTATDFAGGSTGALRFQLRAVTPGSKAYVRNLTVIAIELPASDFVFVEDLMRVDVAAGGWAPVLTLSVPRAGSWTVLAGATATATPDGGVALRVSDRLQRAPPSWSDGGPRTFGLLDGPGWPQLLTVRTHQLEPGEVITLEAMAAPGSGLQADSGTVAALLDTRLMAFSSPLVSVTSLNTQGSTSLSTGSAPIIDVTQSEGAGTAYLQLQHVHAAPFIAGPATVVLEGRGALTTVARAGLEGHHLSATSAKAWVGTGAMLTSRVTGGGLGRQPAGGVGRQLGGLRSGRRPSGVLRWRRGRRR